jgi:hypothetical protein
MLETLHDYFIPNSYLTLRLLTQAPSSHDLVLNSLKNKTVNQNPMNETGTKKWLKFIYLVSNFKEL